MPLAFICDPCRKTANVENCADDPAKHGKQICVVGKINGDGIEIDAVAHLPDDFLALEPEEGNELRILCRECSQMTVFPKIPGSA